MTDTWTWATVTQATPLRIKVDGDTTALDATTDNLVGSLAVLDRVRVHLHSDGIIVTGLQGGASGGGTPEATAATANTLAKRDGSGQLKVADGVADDDVATVGQLSAGDTGWIGYTPVTVGLTIGYGSLVGRYRKRNGWVDFAIYLTSGYYTDIYNNLQLGLPVTPEDEFAVVGAGMRTSPDAGVFYQKNPGRDRVYIHDAAGGIWDAGTDFGSGDTLSIAGGYQAD